MEDFIRMNLNAFLCSLGTFMFCLIAYIIAMQYTPKELKKKVSGIAGIIVLLVCTSVFFGTVRQVSVNNIPRKSIDRSYTKQTQKNYQSTVTQTKEQ